MLLRHYLEQGVTKAALARQLGVSRRTIYHWLATEQLDRELDNQAVRYGPRRSTATKLDPYRGIIDERLGEFEALTAVRLFDEVQAAGYAGGYTQVKEYVRRVRPKPEPEPVQRFETPPGHQGQVDFAEFRLPWGERYALLVVLGYSRLLWLEYHRRQTMEVLMRGLESAFAYFGGVPEELLFDQMKAVIVDDQRVNGGALLKNAQFLRFAAHWGFTIRACRPYRAKTKGKVEIRMQARLTLCSLQDTWEPWSPAWFLTGWLTSSWRVSVYWGEQRARCSASTGPNRLRRWWTRFPSSPVPEPHRKGYRPVSMEGMRQLSELTLALIKTRDHDPAFALEDIRRNVQFIVTMFLKVKETPISRIHSTFLGPYYSSTIPQGLRARLRIWPTQSPARIPEIQSHRR